MSNIVEHLRDEAVKVMIERTGNTGLSSKDVTGSVIWKAADEIERLRALTAPQLHQHGGGVTDERIRQIMSAEDISTARIMICREIYNAQQTHHRDAWKEICTKAAVEAVEAGLTEINPTAFETCARKLYDGLSLNSSFATVKEALREFAATTHPTQSDVSCSRAREGGTV